MEFGNDPSNSTISTTNDTETFFILINILFGKSKTLIFVGFHIVEMNPYRMFPFHKANMQMIVFWYLNCEVEGTLR